MGTESDTKQKTISNPEDIRKHLMELYHLQIPVSFYIDNKVELPGSYFIYDDELDDGLVVKTRAVKILGFSDVEFSYSHFSHTCHFTSKIVSQKKMSRNYSLIQIEIPESISCLEQRRYFRVKPPEVDAVQIEFPVEELGNMNISAFNLSGGGASFLVPSRLKSVGEGNTLPISIRLPNGTVSVNGLIVNTSEYLNLKRIGLEFFDISETDRAAIQKYVLHKQKKEMQWKKNNPLLYDEKYRMVLLGKPKEHRYDFLHDRFDITLLENLKSLDTITEIHPDIAILDLEEEKSYDCIDMLKNAQASRFFPILIAGNNPIGMEISCSAIRYYPPPFKKQFISRIVDSLIQQYKFSKKFIENDWIKFQKNKKRVLVIDIFRRIGKNYLDYLEKIGFSVSVIENEDDLLTKTINSKPDFIILDEKFEKTDLISLCKLMSFNKVLKSIPKILVADNVDNPAELSARNLISGILIRPFPEEELIHKIDAIFLS